MTVYAEDFTASEIAQMNAHTEQLLRDFINAHNKANPRTSCRDLTDRPDDLCSVCWTDHKDTK